MRLDSPYAKLPDRHFWKKAVAERHIYDLQSLWTPMALNPSDQVATAGSCFAQHIGRHLRRRGASYLDLEPPPDFLTEEEARSQGFGIYSCRYGNIYTARQLVQLLQEAIGERHPEEVVWERDGRFYDALRPSVDPVGHDTRDRILSLRKRHLQRVRALFESLDIFVFTLGLTEGWEAISDGTSYPTAPGTVAGRFDPQRYRFCNYRSAEVRNDLEQFWGKLRTLNPRARMLLTVSPVPLTATASGQHVLVATTYSKSALRCVAGEMAADHQDVHYFPSYEIIAGHPSRASFYNPDMRTVNEAGVNLVMSHFFSTPDLVETAAGETEPNSLICDEELLEQYAQPATAL